MKETKLQMPTIKQRVGAMICAGALAMSTMAAPMAAFAAGEDIEPTVSNNTTYSQTNNGGGVTDVTVQMKASGEKGGTAQPKVVPAPDGTPTDQLVDENGDPDPNGTYILNPYYNPDGDGDGLGDMLAFTVPTSINFVSDAAGNLTGPSSDVCYIENESAAILHTSSAQVDFESGWAPVADANASSDANAIDFQIGPSTDMLDASSYQAKTGVTRPADWTMSHKEADYFATGDASALAGKTYYTFDGSKYVVADVSSGFDGTSTYYEKNAANADRVNLDTTGDINNVDNDVTSRTKVATITWYVTQGAGVNA